MEEHTYSELHLLERRHWWYRGTRSIYRSLLRRYVSGVGGLVLDLGCGTGGNLKMLAEWGNVVGLESSQSALALCPPGAALLTQGTAAGLPFRDGAFDLVAMLGVLEHVADDIGALREVRRVCRPGGSVLLLTSAFKALWSQHDEANRHVRRYRAYDLQLRAKSAGFSVRYASYLNFLLFPAAAVVRLMQRLISRRREPHLNMFPVPEPFSTVLAGVLALEGRLMQWVSLPFGVSIVMVLGR
jgi:SAM-dependent methyltransferase